MLHCWLAWRGRPCRPAPLRPSSSTSEAGAVAGAGLADQSRCTGRNELHHDIHQGNAALVPDDVNVALRLEGCLPRLEHVRRARGIVAVVEGRCALLDDHEAEARV